MSTQENSPSTPDTTAKHHTVTVTDDTFEALVLQSDKPVIVDFWAEWCGPCKAIAPSMEALAAEFADTLVIAKVDVDSNKKWKAHYEIKGIPHLLFFHKGEVVERHAGSAPRSFFRAKFEAFLVKIGAIEKPLTAEQQAELDVAVAAADAAKEKREEAIFEERNKLIKFSLDEWTAIRLEFLKRVLPELTGDEAAIAKRGADGEWDEPIYKTYEALRKRLWDEERFADLVERNNKAVEAANTPEMKKFTEKMFADLEACTAEYDATVEAARKRILAAGVAKKNN